jgi:uncharacterized protein YqgC (DUF456 family)
MDELGELAIGLVILAGVLGVVVPILPGLALVVGAVFVWAWLEGTGTAWGVAVLALLLGGIGIFIKYSIPKKRLNESGVRNSTLVLATVVAIIGLFVIPVVGAPIGFVATIYLVERARGDAEHAWPRTRQSLRAVATSIGIELAAALLIAALWFGTVILT